MSLTGIMLRSSKFKSLDYTAPSGGVTAGGMGKIGDTVGAFYEAKDEGETVAFVYKADMILLPKVAGVAIALGGLVYYDATNLACTGTKSTNVVIGRALEAAAAADTTVLIELDGAYPVEAATS